MYISEASCLNKTSSTSIFKYKQLAIVERCFTSRPYITGFLKCMTWHVFESSRRGTESLIVRTDTCHSWWCNGCTRAGLHFGCRWNRTVDVLNYEHYLRVLGVISVLPKQFKLRVQWIMTIFSMSFLLEGI